MSREEYGRAYETDRRRTVRFLLSRGLPLTEASEAAQAAWARGWERRHQIRDRNSTLSWVNAIALNMYRTRLRTARQEGEFEDRSVPPEENTAAIDVERLLAGCRPADRELLEKHYLEGYDIQELARQNECPASTVRVRLMRARRSIRERLERKRRCVAARCCSR